MIDEELIRGSLSIAYRYAGKSPDLSTQNGAVIIDPVNGWPVCGGFNAIPWQCKTTEERLQPPAKYSWTEHAERAAILEAARVGEPLSGMWMACCWAACADCARAIALSGITKLIRHRPEIYNTREDWNATIAVGDQILKECGVEIVDYTLPMNVTIRFSGKNVQV